MLDFSLCLNRNSVLIVPIFLRLVFRKNILKGGSMSALFGRSHIKHSQSLLYSTTVLYDEV